MIIDAILELVLRLVENGQVDVSGVVSALMVVVICWVWLSKSGVTLVDLPVYDKVLEINFVLLAAITVFGSIFDFDIPQFVPWMVIAILANQIIRAWAQTVLK